MERLGWVEPGMERMRLGWVEAESIHGKNSPKAVSLTLLFKKHPTLSD